MSKIVGKIIDKHSGLTIEARVQVLSVEGRFLHPPDAILKVGPGHPFFYSDGHFEVETTRGLNQILVERGTEYIPARRSINVPACGAAAIDIELERWTDLPERGWHPGNTHIHYDQHEQRPDERLRLDPRVEDLRLTAISLIRRWDRPYAVNKYPAGVLTDFCSAHHYVECGEESRHNSRNDSLDEGYGHIMLLRLKDVVEPISRGFLVDETDPDYPPLCYACDEAHRQGGIVIWCHNGRGIEAPVAAALGKLDAFNLFDPFWMDPEYRIWYAMLNCGIRLPASTGSDWYISSANRVYTYTGRSFAYEDWMQALQAGRTFITNGPALYLKADEQLPGDTILSEPGRKVTVSVEWKSFYPVHLVEVVYNGRTVISKSMPRGSLEGSFTAEVTLKTNGWLAARISSTERDSFVQSLFAHTSPIYVGMDRQPIERKMAAKGFIKAIDDGLERLGSQYRFHNEKQQNEVVELFKQGRAVYQKIAGR